MNFSEIESLISSSHRIALIAHIMPDGDTLGSCLALGTVLKDMGKNVSIFCQDGFPDSLRFLKGIETIQKPDRRAAGHYDLVIALDCSDIERLGDCRPILDECTNTVNIDHHISNKGYGKFNWVDPCVSATGELVYELIKSLLHGRKLPIPVAESLYTAISTDTGSFCYSNTTPRTHRIVADLLETGIDVSRISSLLYKNKKLKWVMLLSEVLNTLELHFNDRVAALTVTQAALMKVGADETFVDGLIDYAKDIEGVEIGLLFREVEPNKIKVGFRSKFEVDVSQLAQIFGGGGHKRAAGCMIDANLDQSKSLILKEIHSLFERKSIQA